ncbi:MAG: hypothetical protein JRF40_08960 [Deltaproteobacteria bacterium]|nr:hypothetical protein [Deltaproteobacteria bacterium]
MSKSNRWLLEYAQNIYSQNGEDGILKKMLDTIPHNDKWCVEFGAWDGKHLSNTFRLVEEFGYHAVLIEGNPKKFKHLIKLQSDFNTIIPINAFVGYGSNSLDNILKQVDIPKDFDIISIDIDGNDYHVWSSIRDYKPKIVCIEYNSTVPNDVEFVQEKKMNVSQGSSLFSLKKLGESLGYELVCVTVTNTIFVKKEFFPLFGIQDNSLNALRPDRGIINYVFFGFDGTMFLHGAKKLPWHGIAIQHSKIQQLPKCFRKYPGNMGKIRKFFFRLFRVLHNSNISISSLFK